MDESDFKRHSMVTNDPEQMPLKLKEFAGLAVRKTAEVGVTLLRSPSFDPVATWTLYRDDNLWFVRRIICASKGGPLAAKLTPDTYGSEVVFPSLDAERILATLYQMSVRHAPGPDEGIVLDGCKYGIHWNRAKTNIRLEWWCEAPSEWSELRDWYADSITLFQAHLPQSTVPIQVVHPWCE